jgi:hypothetical protein
VTTAPRKLGIVFLIVWGAVTNGSCYFLTWDGSRRPQKVDVSPIMELDLRPDMTSLCEAFPESRVHRVELPRSWWLEDDGSLEVVGFARGDCEARITLYSAKALASFALDRLFEKPWRWGPASELTTGGEGDDRYVISKVREETNHDVVLGPRGTGYYSSIVAIQRGPLLIVIEEHSYSWSVTKDPFIMGIAEALRRCSRDSGEGRQGP